MKMKKRASGGKINKYNAEGSPAMDAAMKERGDGFKRGGRTKRADGGAVGGEASAPRLDQRARGGVVKRKAGGAVPAAPAPVIQKRAHGGSVRGMKSAGGSPMSTGHSISAAKGKSEGGHEGERAAEVT